MLVTVDDMVGGNEDDTKRLRDMAVRAWEYITSFDWCLPITGSWFGGGAGGTVALFLFEFDGMISGSDDRLWVVTGDLPSAYMVVGPDNPKDALEAYCRLMDDWTNAVLTTQDFRNVFPVDAAATREHAEDLRDRIALLRREIIPGATTDSIDAHAERCVPSRNNERSKRWLRRR